MNSIPVLTPIDTVCTFSLLDACSLPKVVGPCFAAFPRWFFNKASGKCEQFIYGGCKGNGNNFEGEKECQAMCLPHKLRLQKGMLLLLSMNQKIVWSFFKALYDCCYFRQ